MGDDVVQAGADVIQEGLAPWEPGDRTSRAVWPAAVPSSPAHEIAVRLTRTYRVELRRSRVLGAPVEVIEVEARTVASARRTAQARCPEMRVLSITRQD